RGRNLHVQGSARHGLDASRLAKGRRFDGQEPFVFHEIPLLLPGLAHLVPKTHGLEAYGEMDHEGRRGREHGGDPQREKSILHAASRVTRAAARSFALRERGFACTSSSVAKIGRLVTTASR